MRAALLALLLFSLGCRQTLVPSIEAPKTSPAGNYQALLELVVTPDGYVDYDKLERNRRALDEYVAWLTLPKAWRGTRPTERPSDWVNAYNALVLYQVLERDRPASVLDVPSLLPIRGAGFFVQTQFQLGKTRLSLSEIEHERVRMVEMDYRVHAALNCASMSCPPLRRELYTHRGFAVQLKHQMARWVDDTRGVRFSDDTVLFSPIFEWFARDFSFWSAGESLCTIAAKYASGRRAKRLEEAAENGCKHDFFEYDWSLNHVRSPG